MQDNNARTPFTGKKSLLELENISQRYQTGSGEPGRRSSTMFRSI